MCHQLKLKLKTPASGKNSTFSKVNYYYNIQFIFYTNISIQVDTVICQTRDLMNAVTRLCTTVFVCQTKVIISHVKLNQLSFFFWYLVQHNRLSSWSNYKQCNIFSAALILFKTTSTLSCNIN